VTVFCVLCVIAVIEFSTHTDLAILMNLSYTPVMLFMSLRRVPTDGLLALVNGRRSLELFPATTSSG